VTQQRTQGLAGGVSSVLPSGVAHLDEPGAVFEAMLTGWGHQQRSRMLALNTVEIRVHLLRRFQVFTGEFPWRWRPADVEDFTASLLSGPRRLAHSTVRNYQLAIRLFCEFITDRRYDWADECERRFGEHPVQICHPWNTVEHLSEFEGRPEVRALTYDELQTFFDVCDDRADTVVRRRRKGLAAALRDAQMFKTMYAWGLRRRELVSLDTVDLRTNPHAHQWGTLGVVHVRYGKAKPGGPPRRRSVLSVPEFDWAIEGLAHYLAEVRTLFPVDGSQAIWVTERGTRVGIRYIDQRFAQLRAEAGLPDELHAHCLRHSYVTHLVEFGYPERFVTDQVGHSYVATTAIYTHVSDDYKNHVLAKALERVYFPSTKEAQ
jgi:integrase/recombinase XerC